MRLLLQLSSWTAVEEIQPSRLSPSEAGGSRPGEQRTLLHLLKEKGKRISNALLDGRRAWLQVTQGRYL